MFGAASPFLKEEYKKLAYDVGRLIRTNGAGLITGAGDTGAMGSIMDGFTAEDHEGEAVGIITHRLIRMEGIHPKLNTLYKVESMDTRKHMLINLSDMLITLPGGFGTMDELMEVITLKQLGISNKTVVVIDIEGGPFSTALKALIAMFLEIGTVDPKTAHGVHFMTIEQFEELL